MHIIGRMIAWVAVLAMPGVTWGLGHMALALWNAQGPVARVDDLVTVGSAAIGAVVAGYLTLTGGAMLIGAAVRGGRAIPRSIAAFAPSSWQRVTAAALGVTLSAGLTAPALASSPTSPHVGWGEPAVADATAAPPLRVSPVGWTPPAAPADVAATPTSTAAHVPDTRNGDNGDPAEQSATYTVAHGDSLWRITAALIGPQASDASINDAWPQLYAANADAIGPDPALIHPGLVLTIPQGIVS